MKSSFIQFYFSFPARKQAGCNVAESVKSFMKPLFSSFGLIQYFYSETYAWQIKKTALVINDSKKNNMLKATS